MATDSSKTNINDFIAKIKLLQENINKQTTVSILDIDLQLDYIRVLYDSYLTLKEDVIVAKEKNEKKSNLSDCGTLSLFDDEKEIQEPEEKMPVQEQEEPSPIEKPIEQPEPEEEQEEESETEPEEEMEMESEPEQETEIEVESELEIEAELEAEVEAEDEIETETGNEVETVNEAEIEIESEPIMEEPIMDIVDEEEVEQPIEPAPNMDVEIDITEVNIPIEEEDIQEEEGEDEDENEDEDEGEDDENEDNEDFSENEQAIVEIDLDAIEFDEEEILEDEVDEKEEQTPAVSSQSGIPAGRPVYWGDEVDVEQPVAAQPASVSDKFKSDRPSLNEIVSGFKPDESIGMKLQHGNVSDLMKSIDMNNKFLFVKELFKGNGSAFTEEINNINSYSKLDAALRYLDEIKAKYHWDDKSEAYKELYHLILRKHAK